MPITVETEGMDNLNAMLASLGDSAVGVAKKALYDGAGVVADAYSQAPGKIRTEPFRGKKPKRLPSPEEKAALEGKTGIARFGQTAEEVNTLVGIGGKSGYVMLGSKRTAIPAIANAINSGTSFMTKQPVFRQARKGSQEAAKEAIVGTAEKLCNEIINGNNQK